MVIPGPGKVKYPVLLDFPPPELDEYTMESTIAEKFQAMVKLGLLNSRMKDGTKQAQWQGFINKTKLADASASFEDVAEGIKGFLQPVVDSIVDRQTFRFFWAAPGPWST